MRAIIRTRLKREAVFTMIAKRFSKNRLVKVIFGCLFAIISLFSLVAPTGMVYADEMDEPVHVNLETESGETLEDGGVEKVEEEKLVQTGASCEDSLGELGWWVCPQTGKIAKAVDWLYEKIEDVLVINPVERGDDSPIYAIWKYARGVTNIIFIIFLLVVIYSQLTGVGISNYGIKKALPKLIVVAILVNLSFDICSLAVDVSNIVGSSLRGLFTSIEQSTMTNFHVTDDLYVSMAEMYSALNGGTALAIGAGLIGFETGSIWMLIPVVLGAVVAVASGLITIALRQAVVMLLIMISPLAIVAYMLPNTEQWFKKWKQLFMKMLVFYPMFSLLFGASSLAGWAIIMSAKDGFGLLLGVAVQIFPLFFSWSLMKMSGTFLGTVNAKIQSWAAKPLAANRAWADSHREATKQKYLASKNAYTPTLRLRQYLSNRKIAREEETKERAEVVRNRGLAYGVNRNYYKNGVPTREGEETYEMQARNMRYQRAILRHKNNLNRGFGQLADVKNNGSAAQIRRLNDLDIANVQAADLLKVEQARTEKIDYDNATSFHNRMEEAMNAHFDEINWQKRDKNGELIYKRHFDYQSGDKYKNAIERYKAVSEVMEGDVRSTQYAAAMAAQMYDTQAKIIATKFQKYFELTPPTQDVMYRLREFSKFAEEKDGIFGKKAVDEIDSIIAGLRVVNQRGDTDLVKSIVDDITNDKYGGLKLGSHASQALASFLMFEVKDNDPPLRRFGKYINLETARAYNENDRKAMGVTYDEYVKGYHEEPDGTRMYARKDMKKLLEGTSLDNVERTAFANLDDSLKKAYGFRKGMKGDEWDVDGYIKKREEIQTALEPAFLSASLKWLSGSEQINSGVKFWTGYELKQKKENGQVVVDEAKDPIYELTPVWEGEEFAGREKQLEAYYRRKTYDYFKDQTTGQILGMRTDYRDPTVEHLVKMYLDDGSEDETSSERKMKYDNAVSEIQARYSNEDPKVAKEKRDEDLKQFKRDVAGRQLRKILDKTGKLEQIYNTRRSGASNNAKDWLRKMLNLDDKSEIYRYLDQKEQELKKKKEMIGQKDQKDNSIGDAPSGVGSPYNDASFRLRVMTTLNKKFEQSGDNPDPDADFYEGSLDVVKQEFGTVGGIVNQYEKFREDNPHASRNELWEKLEEILGNFFAEQMD